MLKRDTSAKLLEIRGLFGILWKGCRLTSGKVYWELNWNEAQYRDATTMQRETPVPLASSGSKRWWIFRSEIYWEDEQYQANEIRALILDRENRKKRCVERAIASTEWGRADAATGRQPIPDDVKTFVWNRDGGKCVKCGSQRNLEFDHIIPVSMGGGNTARNIQLLCETCNRSKGGSLV